MALIGGGLHYRPGYRYAKAGVMLMELGPAGSRQHTLFSDEVAEDRSARLMQTLDSINRKIGKDTLFLASSGIVKGWGMKQGNRSPCYTTDWGELAQVHC